MVKFDSIDYFYDLDHYLTVMASEADIEWRCPHLQMGRIQEIPATISLRKVGPTIVAIARFDPEFINDNLLPEEMKGTAVSLPDLTDVQVILEVAQTNEPDDVRISRDSLFRFTSKIPAARTFTSPCTGHAYRSFSRKIMRML
ncbi:hypothetical protein BDW59DRAFT_153823 [Aspergillus cavernicola]|uniref:Uncharacterized protein n=1 Tax=Aspergillus cavernicola TaxID=176166 RepID=A0ABR4HJX4_9EURO